MKRDAQSSTATRHVARRTNRGRKAYVMKSVKNGLEIRLESQDELALARVLDLDPRGSQLYAQSETFDLVSGEVYHALPDSKHEDSRYYTPDLIDVIFGIKYVFEVKPQRFLLAHQELFDAVGNFCLHKGMRFVVISKENLGSTLLNNVALLHQFARQCKETLPAWAEAVDKLPVKNGHVRQVLDGLDPLNYYLVAAILQGVLTADLRKNNLASMDFCVEPAHGDLKGLEFVKYD
tara:strand:- start:7911 stop:8615 length:705 start_codon:yes stop_codon:yes gene_type:complete